MEAAHRALALAVEDVQEHLVLIKVIVRAEERVWHAAGCCITRAGSISVRLSRSLLSTRVDCHFLKILTSLQKKVVV